MIDPWEKGYIIPSSIKSMTDEDTSWFETLSVIADRREDGSHSFEAFLLPAKGVLHHSYFGIEAWAPFDSGEIWEASAILVDGKTALPGAGRLGLGVLQKNINNTINTKMTKHILSLIASVYFIISLNAIGGEPAKAHQTEKEAQCVVITYRQPIQDFDVMILWRPKEQMRGYLIGPAIMEFTHKEPSKSFSLVNNRFGLPDSDDWMKTATIKEGYYVKTSQPHLVLDYAVPEMTDQLPSTWFFFLDLNFDGKKELVVTECANGQRGRNTYQVHVLSEIGYMKSHTTTAQEPFPSLDSDSKIDFQDRTIRLFNSSGAYLSEQLLYKFDESLRHYRLTEREEMENEPLGSGGV